MNEILFSIVATSVFWMGIIELYFVKGYEDDPKVFTKWVPYLWILSGILIIIGIFYLELSK